MRRIHRWLAGNDGPGRRALPAGELLHPLPLAAAVVMAINDQLLKGAGLLPNAVTGKLSDFAGLLFFPLLCTAGVDLVLLVAARLGAPVDFTLRRSKLVIAVLFTAALFLTINVSQAAADGLAGFVTDLGIPSSIVADPADLIALPCLAIAYWWGRREIARVPLGRLELIERRYRRGRRDVDEALADVARCGGDAGEVGKLGDALSAYLDGGEPEPVEKSLSRLRGFES